MGELLHLLTLQLGTDHALDGSSSDTLDCAFLYLQHLGFRSNTNDIHKAYNGVTMQQKELRSDSSLEIGRTWERWMRKSIRRICW